MLADEVHEVVERCRSLPSATNSFNAYSDVMGVGLGMIEKPGPIDEPAWLTLAATALRLIGAMAPEVAPPRAFDPGQAEQALVRFAGQVQPMRRDGLELVAAA